MSWMGKLLSSAGIGSTKVDTLLENNRYSPGDTIDAIVKIMAGRAAQRIDAIQFSVHCQLDKTHQAQIAHCMLAEDIEIQPDTIIELPVKLALPDFTPLSGGPIQTWLHTGLDIPHAIDPQDQDPLEVVPTRQQQQVLDAMLGLQLKLTDIEIEPLPQQNQLGVPFLQRWHYQPPAENSFKSISKISMAWRNTDSGLELMLEVIGNSNQRANPKLTLPQTTEESLEPMLLSIIHASVQSW